MSRSPQSPARPSRAAALLGLLALTATAGCRHSARNYLSRHVVPVCPDGELAEFRFREPEAADGFEGTAGGDLPAQIDHVIQAAEFALERGADPGGPLRLLLHVHGGRKTLTDSAELADELITVMGTQGRDARSAGAGGELDRSAARSEPPLYPIFVQWQSDDRSTVKDRLLFLRQGKHLKFLGPLSSPFILAHDLVRGIARLPRSLGYQVVRDVNVATSVLLGNESFGSEAESADVVRALGAEDGPRPSFDVRPAAYERGFLPHATRFVVYFLTQPTKILSQGLFLEGLGQGAWDEMRRRAHGLVWRPATFEDGLAPHETAANLGGTASRADLANGALPLIYASLGDLDRTIELTIVAHSMGAIAVNESLPCLTRAMDDSAGRLRVPRIVYMAPACSTLDAADSLVPFLEGARGGDAAPTQFYYLALHPTAEADETNVADLVQRGSLLEWIDVFYTNPATVPERVFGKWSNAIPALSLFAPVASQVHFKAFDVRRDSFPQKHGQFHEIPFWTPAAYEPHPESAPSYRNDWLSETCSDVLEVCETDPAGYRPW